MPYKDREKQKEYQRNYQRQWRENNREKIKGYWQKFYYTHQNEVLTRKRRQQQQNEQTYEIRARRHHRSKIEILRRYSGEYPKCAYCGENRYECLQIDHINDDGCKERKITGGGENFYAWLKKQPYQPDRYQVLCANCNVIKRVRGLVSYNQGLETINEWDEWSKSKYIKTPEAIKEFWHKR